MQYYNDYFQHLPSNDFGYSLIWNLEVNKWLEYVNNLDSGFYERNKKRVLIDKQRDEFLGEIKSVYFIGQVLNFNIVDLEPQGKNQTKLDLSFEDMNNQLWKVEVKSPSWEGQVWKNPNLTLAQKKIRISQPKYIKGEGGSFSPEEEMQYAAEDSIKNALQKFTKGDNNLIISPDMRLDIIPMLGISAMAGGSSAIQDELSLQDFDEIISCVLILEPILPSASDKIIYSHKFIPIMNCLVLPSHAEKI